MKLCQGAFPKSFWDMNHADKVEVDWMDKLLPSLRAKEESMMSLCGLRKYDEALAAAQKCPAIREELGDESQLAMVHHTIGKVWLEQQRHTEAEQSLRERLSVYENLADRQSRVLLNQR